MTLEEGVTVSMLVAEDSTDGRVTYVVREGNEEIARVPDEVSLPTLAGTEPSKQDPTTRRSLLELPAFGVTFLGTSHGFDPKGSTTGFVLWIHGRGILVDPPPNAGTILNMMGVPPRIVDTVLLTHCHADHDAGTFQKLLHEEQVTLITTQTILRSFMRKCTWREEGTGMPGGAGGRRGSVLVGIRYAKLYVCAHYNNNVGRADRLCAYP